MASNSNDTPMEINDLRRLRRFLALGAETGPYKPTPVAPPLSKEMAPTILNLVSLDKGDEVVREIQRFHEEELSAHPDSIVFSLALCARDSDPKTKSTAYDKAFSKVCKTPLQLFSFVNYCSMISKTRTGCGWGKAHRKAVASFYNSLPAKELCLALCRYVRRLNWSHRDILKLAHVKPSNEAIGVVLQYVMKGYFETIKHHEATTNDDVRAVIELIKVINTVKHSEDAHQVARLVEENKLSLEFIPTKLHPSKEIWQALIRHMTLREVLDSLGRASGVGLFVDNNPALEQIQCRITDSHVIKREKLHPLEILIAMKNYEYNKYQRQWTKRKPAVTSQTAATPSSGQAKYQPTTDITNSLKKAFYVSFKHLCSTNKRILVAVDVKGPGGRTMGSPFVTPLVAASGIAMTFARTEKQVTTVVYDSGISTVKLTSDMDLDSVSKVLKRTNTRATDCSLPVIWATEKSLKFDVIIVITDKPCLGSLPAVALKQYRDVLNMPATRMMTVFLTCSRFGAASSEDQLMLDLIGLDKGTPKILHTFVQGVL